MDDTQQFILFIICIVAIIIIRVVVDKMFDKASSGLSNHLAKKKEKLNHTSKREKL
ncbi:TPA: hypothetical protein ACGO7F_001803 [Streptococcus suis]